MEKTQEMPLIKQMREFMEGLSIEQKTEFLTIISTVFALGEEVGATLGVDDEEVTA